MKRLKESLIVAFSMYSKIPMPRCDWNEGSMSYAMCFWPLVGAVIGGLVYGWGILSERLGVGAIFFAVIAILISVLVTGGIHLDGLLDTSDALSSWQTQERRLEILKDSHTGAFAIITCVFYALTLLGIYTQVDITALATIVFGFVLSRSLSGLAIINFKKAKQDGTVAKFSQNAQTKRVRVVMIIYITVISAIVMVINPLQGGVMLLAAVVTYLYYYHMAMKYFGGTTGDLAGWFLSLCELVMPLSVVLTGLITRSIG